MTRQRRWQLAGGAVALAGLLAGAPRAATALAQWRLERREALISGAARAIARGDDSVNWGLLHEPSETQTSLTRKPGQPEKDDAELRAIATAAEFGPRDTAFNAQLLAVAAAEAARWAPGAAVVPAPVSSPGTRKWQSLGPASARSEWNGSYYTAVDSGRPTGIAVDDSNGILYLATSGGGVWKSANVGNTAPTWTSITDALGLLAIGAIDVLPGASEATNTIWLGLGDSFDQTAGLVVKSSDGGATWGAPIALTGTHPDGRTLTATMVRDLRIDPTNTSVILVATDVGFFRSTDGGATFALVDLPNPGVAALEEATWSLAYLGASGGKSQWALTGLQLCVASTQTQCNYGDIWRSTDGAQTWTSARAAGTLPVPATPPVATGLQLQVGRMTIAAGAPTANGTTAVYVQAAGYGGRTQEGVFKSLDSGQTWTVVANVATPVTNPTNTYDGGNGPTVDCANMNVGHAQAYYNQAIAVDPANNNNAIVGGNLCSVRTTDGGATWQNVSHWLPGGGIGTTPNGPLPYVHADWHVAKSLVTSKLTGRPQAWTFAGTDGGFFMSANLFTVANPESVAWSQPDSGLTTHLTYGLASGDFTSGNPNIVFTGLQDNGTRWRQNEFAAGTFDQIIGGDGIGTAVAADSAGQNPLFFASVEFGHFYCNPRKRQCGNATAVDPALGEIPNWFFVDDSPVLSSLNDGDPFFVRYAPLGDAFGTVLVSSTYNVLKLNVDQNDNFGYQAVSANIGPTSTAAGSGTFHGHVVRGLGVQVAPATYTIGGKPSRIYGAVLSGGAFAVASDDLQGHVAWTYNVSRVATATGTLSYTNSITWPRNPASLGGTDITKTWLVSLIAPAYNNGRPIEASVGRVFKTTDAGATWVPFAGNHTGYDLPNVPVAVIRYDPDDASDQTIWAGTDLGVYRSTDGGQTWARYGQGMPMARISDLFFSHNGSLVRAATYGRGLWEITPGSEPRAGTAGKGDFDRDGAVDFSDVLAAASRVGTTPATAPAPGMPAYDWALDTTGKGSIDASDLNAITAKLGSTP